jgi:ligand-binding sensor domain-containing protein
MKKILAIGCIFASLGTYCQNTIGLPYIINYTKTQYHAGAQAFDIRQDSRGILYFANNDGLLSFDGARWRVNPLPTDSRVISMGIGRDGRIYTGSQKEIGYFAPGPGGKLEYTSLTDLIPKPQDFSEVWDVIPVDDRVFFRANRNIYEYSNGRITPYHSIDWNFLGYSNGILLAHDHKAGLVEFQSGQWVPLNGAAGIIPGWTKVTSFVPINKDSSLITTMKTGMFILAGGRVTPFVSADIKGISQMNISDAKVIDDSTLAIGTNLGGCYIIDRRGNTIRHLTKETGIQNNNILALFTDKEKNLWIGLDNGIDYLAYNSPIKQIFPASQDRSSGYTADVFNNALYLGTANGLYRSPLSSKDIGLSRADFQLVKRSKGLVWNLSEVNGHLLMGHNEGAFEIKDTGASLIANNSGFWRFQPMSTTSPSPWVVAGCYNGINFYNYENGRFIDKNIHSHFESALYSVIDDDVIWALHPFNGLYRVTMKNNVPDYTVYRSQPEIFTKNNNHLFKIKNRLVLTNSKGIFEFNHIAGKFESSVFFDSIFGKSHVQYMREDAKGRIWFIQNKRVGVVNFPDAHPRKLYFPELDDKLVGGNHEFIYPLNDHNVLLGGEEGFYLLDYSRYFQGQDSIPVFLRSVRGMGRTDKVYFDGYYPDASDEVGHINQKRTGIGYDFNSVKFEFATPLYSHQNTIEYAVFLERFDKTWSDWSKKSEANYTNLPVGSYIFHVRARTPTGDASYICSYTFSILAPWYRSWWAYTIYGMLLVLSGIILYRQHEKKLANQQSVHDKEQEQTRYMHQLELGHTESEIMRLENEKLANEVQYKNSELASTAMNMVQKNETLGKIREAVLKLKKTTEPGQIEDGFKSIFRLLDENRIQQDWDTFAQHFDQVYSDFLSALKEEYPFLTTGDAKLCAYLRLNLSSKEIAQLMSITVKSVELSRYRLRKKLQLPKETNLMNFLANFHSEYKNRRKDRSL